MKRRRTKPPKSPRREHFGSLLSTTTEDSADGRLSKLLTRGTHRNVIRGFLKQAHVKTTKEVAHG